MGTGSPIAGARTVPPGVGGSAVGIVGVCTVAVSSAMATRRTVIETMRGDTPSAGMKVQIVLWLAAADVPEQRQPGQYAPQVGAMGSWQAPLAERNIGHVLERLQL
jgi:hypothetical protein